MVKVRCALNEPTFWAVNVRVVGLMLIVVVGSCPVPVRVADWGLPEPSLVTVRLGVRLPAAVGLNATPTEQAWLAGNVDGLEGQVLFVIAKSPALVPERAMLEMVTAAVPVLVMEINCVALVLPIVIVLKSRVMGDRVSTRFVFWPVPDKPMTSGLPVASLATDREADLPPVALGVKVRLTLQLPFAARVAGLDGQVLAEIL